ncbi:hypothetical protein [Burkholderia sp. PAMC 26561]|uniref:hypothetical protein n=1 Tax=Burkholderia sp. PAMC 26561 TaxID=1795043 RepID=UPI0013C4068F|nr:hypothetical protein [Burkholderia sp. PAMC 26561]
MTTELMRYEGHRFMLYKRWDYAPHGRTKEQQEALDAGQALFKAANFEHWASQPALVERIQTFLVRAVPSYRPSPYGDRPRDVINALCWEVRNGAALIVRAKPAYIAHSGFAPALTEDERYRREMADMAERGAIFEARTKWYQQELAEYHQLVEDAERAARPPKVFRHIETIAEAAVRNRAAWAARDALAALASTAASAVASALPSMGDDDVFDLGNVSEVGTGSTPLGDAAPFEYAPSATGDDVLSVAARGVSEAIETQCMDEYERALDMCGAVAYPMGLSRGMALCRENAFDRYQQCRGY